jgi:ABC-type oligopeptide transport system substrate-binding subunit
MRGSQNLAGMSDPVIDALIDKIIAADNRTSLTTACRVLDRVIRTGRYWVPHWYKASPQCLHSEYGPAVQEFVPLLAPRAALRK